MGSPPSLSLRLDEALHEQVRRLAEGTPERLSINQVILSALRFYLDVSAGRAEESSFRRGEAAGLLQAARWCRHEAEQRGKNRELLSCADDLERIASEIEVQARRLPPRVLTNPAPAPLELQEQPGHEGAPRTEIVSTPPAANAAEFDREHAIEMWKSIVGLGYDYDYMVAVRQIAQASGLGELSPAATDAALRWIRADYGTADGRLTRSSRERWQGLTATRDPAILGMWADAIARAAREFPKAEPPSRRVVMRAKSSAIEGEDVLGQVGLSSRLFRALKKMDEEATNQTYWKGHPFPTGLRYYDKHLQPDPIDAASPRFCPERAWPERLKALLTDPAMGIYAASQQPYPGTRQTCDLVVTLPGARRLWIEIKGCWRYNRDTPERVDVTMWRGRELWEKHLKSPTEGAAKDFLKLAALTPAHASHVGVLVIGFDVQGHFEIRDEDIAEMKANAGYDPKVWREDHEEWPDAHQEGDARHGLSGFRVRCWFWHRGL